MKLVIYGVSRSGKDFLIDEVCTYLQKKESSIQHIKGSAMLNAIADSMFHTSFRLLNEDNQEVVRKQFVKNLDDWEKRFENIIVDGHYAFYNKDGDLYDVITDDDLHGYDVFLYLNTPSKRIMERIDSVKTEFKEYSVERIDQWKDYEIEHLTNDLLKRDQELHVIQNDDLYTIQYIEGLIHGKYDSKKIAQDIVNQILNHSNNDAYIVTDCDKTLSKEDSTVLAFHKKGFSDHILRQIYEGDHYTNYQAYLALCYCKKNDVFDKDTICYAIHQLSMNEEVIRDLKHGDYKIIGLSGGNEKIWNGFLDRCELSLDFYNHGMIMSKYIKYFVVKYLIEQGKRVISLGDSMMDSLMLQVATKGYLVNTKGYRKNIELFLLKNQNIYQLSYNQFIYPKNMVDQRISFIRLLDKFDHRVKELTDLTKSDSGVQGKKLRKAHYEIGQLLGNKIHEEFPDEKFIVIIMMRSGLFVGSGLADVLDCPIILYDDVNKFMKEWEQFAKNKEFTALICDGVVNSGRTIIKFIEETSIEKFIVVTNVICSNCKLIDVLPIYAARISNHSFVGYKQKEVSNGKGPDTSDRLFKLL